MSENERPTPFEDAAEEFLAYLRATQSPRSARAYGTAVRHFLRYLNVHDPAPSALAEIQPPVVVSFIPYLYEYLLEEVAGCDPDKVRPATRHNYLHGVKRFLEWLVIETQRLPWTAEQYDVIQKAFRRASRYNKSQPLSPNKLPTPEIIEALRETVRQPVESAQAVPVGEARRQELARLRNIAAVEMLISSGMRVGELVRLERGDLLHDVRGALVRFAKGGKEREVLFGETAWADLTAYLRARGDSARGSALARLPVLARHDRRAGSKVLPISVRSIQNVMAGLAERSGIAERFHLTPHTLRHFFATEFLSASGDLSLTQHALGHSWPTTTRIYAQTKKEDYRRAHRQVFGGE